MTSSSTPKRILVIPLRYIGDTILTVPLIRNLRTHFPDAIIDVLASRTAAPLLEPCPYLNHVHIEPKGSLKRLKLLKQQPYDIVFNLRKSVSMALMCRLAGISMVIGYDKQRFPWGYKRWGAFLHRQARYPSLRTQTPQALSNLSLLEAYGLPIIDSHLELWGTETDHNTVAELLSTFGIDSEKPIAVVHAASASHGKALELETFTTSLQALHQAGYQLLTTGTASDEDGYNTLAKAAQVPVHILAGKTSLRETFALYQRAKLLLTVDSSPIHIGAAAGIPNIIGVFGPTNHQQWGPYNSQVNFEPVFIDLDCRPCYAKVCSHNNCRTLITAEQIASSVQKLS